jgi:hypothetical protein
MKFFCYYSSFIFSEKSIYIIYFKKKSNICFLFFLLDLDVVIVIIIHTSCFLLFNVCFSIPISTIIIIHKQRLIHAIWPHHTFFLLMLPCWEWKMVFLKQIEWKWKKRNIFLPTISINFLRFFSLKSKNICNSIYYPTIDACT